MITNALSPMRVVEALQDVVREDGLIGAMSSGQGSIANNEKGLRDVYRDSKAALNMLMKSFAARQPDAGALALIAPGWIRTDLGGPDAPFTIEETVPLLVDVLIAKRGRPGLEYPDRFGVVVPWYTTRDSKKGRRVASPACPSRRESASETGPALRRAGPV